MNRPVLHFVHGNSFPAETYRLFFEHLARDYQVGALPLHAHNPAYPVTDGWVALARELEDELNRRYDRAVVLIGHSMGGVLSLMVAKKRPDLVRAVILLDAPVVAGWRALLLRVAKSVGLDKTASPARFSEKRRNLWPDKETAYRHYASRKAFAAWPPEVLRDYIEHGLVPHAQGVTLRFARETETAVYRSLPHHIGKLVRRAFPVPVGFIGGADSAECRQAGMAATRRLVGPHFRLLSGGHLFPLESPAAAAAAVRQMVEDLLAPGPAAALAMGGAHA